MSENEYNSFQRLRDLFPYLKPAQGRVAKYIMNHPREVINLDIRELAKKTNTAPSTVVELCKKLGFSGFRNLKIALAQELEVMEFMSLDLSKIPRISKNLIGFIVDNLEPSLSLISDKALRESCEILLNSKIVEVMAFGFDEIAGYDLFIKLKQLGFQVNFFENPYLQSISASYATNESCAVVISSSRISRDLLDSISCARKAGAKIIGIVSPNSKMAEVSDVVLPTYSKVKILPEGGILTCYIQLFVIDTLFLKLLEMGKGRFQKAYKDFEEILNYKRKRRRY